MNSSEVEIGSARASRVFLTDDTLTVDLTDGRTISVPLAWYPRLWEGTSEERNHFQVFGDGAYIHWPDLDEDLTVDGLLAGHRSAESPSSIKNWLAERAKSKGTEAER